MENKFENKDNKIINQGQNTISTQNIYVNSDESKDWGVIEEIFKYVFAEIVKHDEFDINKKDNKITNLISKIPLNFRKREVAKRVEETLTVLFPRIMLIDKFIETTRVERVTALFLDIRRKFCNLLGSNNWRTPVKDYKIFEKLAEQYLPDNKKSNPDYFANALALILFFFEHCEFGKKTDEENNNKQINFLFQ
jgi:hypothetical protein